MGSKVKTHKKEVTNETDNNLCNANQRHMFPNSKVNLYCN